MQTQHVFDTEHLRRAETEKVDKTVAEIDNIGISYQMNEPFSHFTFLKTPKPFFMPFVSYVLQARGLLRLLRTKKPLNN